MRKVVGTNKKGEKEEYGGLTPEQARNTVKTMKAAGWTNIEIINTPFDYQKIRVKIGDISWKDMKL